MEPKKISFGFSKLTKTSNIIPQKSTITSVANKKELIDCLEDQNIKVKDFVEKIKQPLIIPLNEPGNKIIDRIIESRANKIEVKKEIDERPDSELTLDELAARELIREAQNSNILQTASKLLTLPAVKDELIIEGKEEPTLDDYENVPISDYGMAMLRGMGWKEGMSIGKNQKEVSQTKEPTLRPKGLGLGANKMANAEKPQKTKEGTELTLKKGGFAKITAGHHKGCYCEVEGFDDEAGRVIVKIALKNVNLSLNEFLIIPVTKEEYIKSSKVINNAKYEEYKEKSSSSNAENGHRTIDTKTECKYNKEGCRSSSSEHSSSDERETHRRERYKKQSTKDRERSRSRSRRRKHSKKSKKHKRNRSRSHSRNRNERHDRKHDRSHRK